MICRSYTKSGKRCRSYACKGKKKCVFLRKKTSSGAKKKTTKSSKKEYSSEERFLRRQAVRYGTKYGAPLLSIVGYEISKWASRPRGRPKYIRSHLHHKVDVKYKGVDYNKPLKRKWPGLTKKNPVGRDYGHQMDYRTRPRSRTGKLAGGAIAGAGRLLPAIGAAWVMHDLASQYFGGPSADEATSGFARRSYSETKSRTERVVYGVEAGVQAYKQLPLPIKLLTAAAVNTL